MTSRMRHRLSSTCKKVLCRTGFALYKNKPITAWPRWMSTPCAIKLPNAKQRRAPSPKGGSNFSIMLALLEKTRDVDGDVAECGVWQGESIVPIAYHVKQSGKNKTVFGLDSFEGFDDTIALDLKLGGAEDEQKKIGGFNDTSLDKVKEKVERFGVDSHTRLIKGYFQKTLSQIEDRCFSFVHLDCDIYESYKVCLEFFYPRMSPNGVILLDEYNDPTWPGCNKAIDEFLSDKPEACELIERETFIKYYIQKQP